MNKEQIDKIFAEAGLNLGESDFSIFQAFQLQKPVVKNDGIDYRFDHEPGQKHIISYKDQFFSPSEPDRDADIIKPEEDNIKLKVALKQFGLFNKPSIHAPTFLAKYKKQDFSVEDLQGYSFDVDHGIGPSKRMNLERVSRWYDAPYTFVLMQDFNPLATLSFQAESKAVLISQIQGVKGSEGKLKPLKWARGVIGLTCDWAKQNAIPEVRVLPSTRNTSPKVQERGFMNYDIPARREGFKYNEESQLYVKRF